MEVAVLERNKDREADGSAGGEGRDPPPILSDVADGDRRPQRVNVAALDGGGSGRALPL